jgi:hypothetical protein
MDEGDAVDIMCDGPRSVTFLTLPLIISSTSVLLFLEIVARQESVSNCTTPETCDFLLLSGVLRHSRQASHEMIELFQMRPQIRSTTRKDSGVVIHR